jgi:hypothetical protein
MSLRVVRHEITSVAGVFGCRQLELVLEGNNDRDTRCEWRVVVDDFRAERLLEAIAVLFAKQREARREQDRRQKIALQRALALVEAVHD